MPSPPPPPGFAMVKCGDLNKRMYGGALQLHASFVKLNTFFLCVICVRAPGAFAHWWTGSPKSLPWFLPVALKSTPGQITPPPPPAPRNRWGCHLLFWNMPGRFTAKMLLPNCFRADGRRWLNPQSFSPGTFEITGWGRGGEGQSPRYIQNRSFVGFQ